MRLALCVSVLTGCSNPFAQCAGSLIGTYEGAGGGTVSASLSDDGDLSLALVDESGETVINSILPVEEDGSISTPSGVDVQVNGAIDLEACTAAGDWASLDGNGTWAIAQ